MKGSTSFAENNVILHIHPPGQIVDIVVGLADLTSNWPENPPSLVLCL